MALQNVVTELPLGMVTVHSDVLVSTVNKSLGKVEGVRPAHKAGGVMAILSGGEDSVRLEVNGDQVNVEVRVDVVLGFPVPEASRAIQQAVREDLEELGCARVGQVSVSVKKLVPPEEEPRSDAQEE